MPQPSGVGMQFFDGGECAVDPSWDHDGQDMSPLTEAIKLIGFGFKWIGWETGAGIVVILPATAYLKIKQGDRHDS